MKLRRPEFKKARIEIIPMIDTIFFLLVFFMITSLSLVQMSAKKVSLPVSMTAQARTTDMVVLTVTKDGAYYVDRQKSPVAGILTLLQQKVRQNPHITVVINCDREQQVAQFQNALQIATRANPAALKIATTPGNSSSL